MINLFELVEDIEYIKKFKVGVVGSRMIAELLYRMGIEHIHYIGDFITPNDFLLDVSIRPLEANSYDVPDARFCSYMFTEDYKELKRQLRGADVIIAHKHMDLFSRIARDLGVPFMPNFITTFLPDGISFMEVEIPKIDYDPVSYSINCSIQACEVLRLLTGYEKPIIAPEACVVDLRMKNYLRMIRLK